jgi:hypothetical protein
VYRIAMYTQNPIIPMPKSQTLHRLRSQQHLCPDSSIPSDLAISTAGYSNFSETRPSEAITSTAVSMPRQGGSIAAQLSGGSRLATWALVLTSVDDPDD